MQHRIAIIYATSEGQTRKVAEHLAERFREHGEDVAVLHADELPLDYTLDNSDGVILGASIHVGRHQDFMVDYVDENHDKLDSMPNAFYSVSLSTATGEDEQAAGYIEEFEQRTGWKPQQTARFGGALRYSEYNFLTRPIMQKIARDAGADTDTSQDWEYTDWDAVDSFAEAFLKRMDEWREAGRPDLSD
jgi:menaquinone-dependent protoporphyrinogen oxidase